MKAFFKLLPGAIGVDKKRGFEMGIIKTALLFFLRIVCILGGIVGVCYILFELSVNSNRNDSYTMLRTLNEISGVKRVVIIEKGDPGFFSPPALRVSISLDAGRNLDVEHVTKTPDGYIYLNCIGSYYMNLFRYDSEGKFVNNGSGCSGIFLEDVLELKLRTVSDIIANYDKIYDLVNSFPEFDPEKKVWEMGVKYYQHYEDFFSDNIEIKPIEWRDHKYVYFKTK